MKRLLAPILLATLFYTIIGYFLVFQYADYCAYQRFKHTEIHENRLVRISKSEVATDKTVEWEEKDEFRYQGKMYDVVREDNQFYYCYNDNYETSLYEGLLNTVGQYSETAVDKPFQSIPFLKDYVTHSKIELSSLTYSILSFSSIISKLVSIEIPFPERPPKEG